MSGKELVQQWRAYYRTHQMAWHEDEDSFAGEVTFGTGGIRGLMGVGPNRINVPMVKRATLGLANWLHTTVQRPKVVISYDTRQQSFEFATAAATTLAAAGVRAYLAPQAMPTPVLSFATRYYHADAGIMITASHNPAQYNGYKIYDDNGCQLVPSQADAVAAQIAKIDDPLAVPNLIMADAVNQSLIHEWPPLVVESYLKQVIGVLRQPQLSASDGKQLCVVYTPLHGTGTAVLPEAYRRAGFANVNLVQAQTTTSGLFETVKRPNPEYLSTFALAKAQAEAIDADLVIATDPDADRLGVMVRTADGFRALNGNQMAALFLDYLITHLRRQAQVSPYVVTTIVTSGIISRMARANHLQYVQTLTGFKYIGESIQRLENEHHRFLFGCEESYGYLFSPMVRDKDAIQAALIVAEMALSAKQQGETLFDLDYS